MGNRTSRSRKAQTRPAMGVFGLADAPWAIGANPKDKETLIAGS
jgi:hypothetical protein